MAYSELIKNYNRIRDYMREFYIYGFRTRSEFSGKSVRSYDNEKRRVESWMGEYMKFSQDAGGKRSFISVDGRRVPRNPLYKAFWAKSFTDRDICLHFALMDILSEEESFPLTEILDELTEYMDDMFLDESTVRKKLKEYTALGLVHKEKEGRTVKYRKSEDHVDLEAWRDGVEFFAETDDMGVIGSFLEERLPEKDGIFSFKHRYLLKALESEIMAEILKCRREHEKMEIVLRSRRRKQMQKKEVYPLRIYVSTQNGRLYFIGYQYGKRRPEVYRMDFLESVRALEREEDVITLEAAYENFRKHLWGASAGAGRKLEHIAFVITYEPYEKHIPARLEREKRIGKLEYLGIDRCRFSADVYDALELIPWIRTFIGRIEDFQCSNAAVERQFHEDLQEMKRMYALSGN